MPLSSRNSLSGGGDRWLGGLLRNRGLGFHMGIANSPRPLFLTWDPLISGHANLAKVLLSLETECSLNRICIDGLMT